MLRNKTLQKTLSLLLVAAYTFVVLFSAKFHTHTHSYFGSDKFQKSDKIASVKTHKSKENDCVACHFLSNKITFPSEDLQLFKPEKKSGSEAFFSTSENEFLKDISYFNLRGPPINFI